jgi:hypothetical protein
MLKHVGNHVPARVVVDLSRVVERHQQLHVFEQPLRGLELLDLGAWALDRGLDAFATLTVGAMAPLAVLRVDLLAPGDLGAFAGDSRGRQRRQHQEKNR